MNIRPIFLLIAVLMVPSNPDPAAAQTGSSSPEESSTQKQQADNQTADSLYLNLSTKTMGGKQFWSDLIHFHGYRIQKNSVTGHHRLLNPKEVRIAWGGFQGCHRELNRIADEKDLTPMKGRVLIVMHGLTRTRTAMKSLEKYITDHSDLQIINVSYASSRSSIDQHAQALASIIRNLPEVEEINFLGHSMGSIVVRYYLGTVQTAGDPRFKRMVMLAPPNHGSRLARVLQDNVLFKTFWGASGQQLSRGWEQMEDRLGTPKFEFGVVAGAQPDQSRITNPLLNGKNDLVVTVEETRLIGASDFYQQPLLHSTMMNDTDVHQASLTFLQNGFFVSEAARKPITKIR